MPAALGSWLGAVVGSAAQARLAWTGAALFLLLTVLMLVRHRSVAALALLVLAAAVASAAIGRHSRTSGPLVDLASRGVAATAEVAISGDPQLLARQPNVPRSVLVAASLRMIRVGSRQWHARLPVFLIAPASTWSTVVPSTRVSVAGNLRAARGSDVAAVLIVHGAPATIRGPTGVQRWAQQVRVGLRESAARLAPAERGLLPGLVVGDTSELPDAVSGKFQAAGLTHLTAVSGANLAIVVAAVFWSLGWVRVGVRLRALVTAAVMVGFILVARPTPSVVRAGSMGLLALAALALGRPRSLLPALFATVLAVPLFDPLLAVRPGFALSVLATFGLIVLVPGWAERLSGWLPARLRMLGLVLAVPLAAQAVCAPIVAAMSGTMSVAAIPANLLALPAVPVATLLGLAAAVIALVWPTMAGHLAMLAGWPCRWLVAVAHGFAHVPLGRFTTPTGFWGFVTVLIVVLAVSAAVRTRGGRRTIALTFVILAVAAIGGGR